jgi:hypothetical protein
MKVHSLTRHSRQRAALFSAGPLVLRTVQGVRATGRELRPTDHASLLADRSLPIAPILIGCSAIKNGRNSRVISAQSISNRPKKACSQRAFCAPQTAEQALQTAALQAPARGSPSLSTARESAASSDPTHGIIVLSYARRGSLIASPDARPATGNRRGTKPASACRHLTLRH